MSTQPHHTTPHPKQPAALREKKKPPAEEIRVAELAIPGYDALDAAEIAERLGRVAFSLPDLKQIEDYEARHRGRRSVILAVRAARSARTHEHKYASF